MKKHLPAVLTFGSFAILSLEAETKMPLVSSDLVFAEKDGIVSIEAEHYHKQELTEKRAWHLTTLAENPRFEFDGDVSHIAGASNGAYLEILPDTRRNHGETLIPGENFSPEPGKLAILSYKVHFETPGTYWIWARNYSTNTEDNGVHFGINGTWPETARRWQTVVKRKWHWKSAQRTKEQHGGVNGILTLEVPHSGEHTIQISMREDGYSLDKFVLANRQDFIPKGIGPASRVKSGALPAPFPYVEPYTISAQNIDFANSGFYLDRGKWAAINPGQRKEARVGVTSTLPQGKYDITIEAVGEEDGESTYQVFVNNNQIGDYKCPLSTEAFEEGWKFHGVFREIELSPGDLVEIAAQVGTDGKEFARARWVGLTFTPVDLETEKTFLEFRNSSPTNSSQ